MGKIYKRGKTYYLSLMVDGLRIRKKVGPSKKMAILALKDLEVKAIRREYDFDIPDGKIEKLFRSFLDYSEVNHAPATTKRYLNVISNVRIFLAYYHPNVKRVSKFNLGIMEKFKRFRRLVDPRTLKLPDKFPYKIENNSHQAKTRTLNYEIKTIKSIFYYGVRNKLCRENPCKSASFLKDTDSKPPVFLTFDEKTLLLDKCDTKFYPILYTFLNTGLRLGELLHLQWADVDFRRRKMQVRKKEFWVPKSGEREIPLNDGMIQLLKNIRTKGYHKKDLIFPGKDGGVSKRKLRKDLIRNAKKVGLNDITKIHSLRHTFASHLLMKGVDLPTVQKLLGHSDIQTTMIYSHLAPDHLVDAVNKLESD